VEKARDLLDILEDRNQTRSTLITSQMPIRDWHGIPVDPTLALRHRLVRNTSKLELKEEAYVWISPPCHLIGVATKDENGGIANNRSSTGCEGRFPLVPGARGLV